MVDDRDTVQNEVLRYNVFQNGMIILRSGLDAGRNSVRKIWFTVKVLEYDIWKDFRQITMHVSHANAYVSRNERKRFVDGTRVSGEQTDE